MVMRSGLPVELVGWDVSIASAVVTPERAAAIRAVGTPLADFTVDIQASVAEAVSSYDGLEGPDLPDPIAMARALDPAPATAVRAAVDVIDGDGPARGPCQWTGSASPASPPTPPWSPTTPARPSS